MTRRELLKKSTVLGLAATMPGDETWAMPASVKSGNGFFEFNVGELQLLVISDGDILVEPVQPTFAPGISGGEIRKVLAASYAPTDYLDLGINILVVKQQNRVVLFDAGCGHLYGSASGKLVANLLAAGIDRKDITDVVLTHAHIDHLGGLTDADVNLVFPNATVHISESEYAFWTESTPDFSRSRASDSKAESMIKQAKKTLSVVEKQLRFFRSGDTLFGCMEMEIASGHTPGHTVTRIYSGDKELIHLADISHTHTLLLAHPEWGNSFDHDFHEANKTRRKMLARVAAKKQRVFSYHFPWPGIGFIRKRKAGFEWVPQSFASPYLSNHKSKAG